VSLFLSFLPPVENDKTQERTVQRFQEQAKDLKEEYQKISDGISHSLHFLPIESDGQQVASLDANIATTNKKLEENQKILSDIQQTFSDPQWTVCFLCPFSFLWNETEKTKFTHRFVVD